MMPVHPMRMPAMPVQMRLDLPDAFGADAFHVLDAVLLAALQILSRRGTSSGSMATMILPQMSCAMPCCFAKATSSRRPCTQFFAL